MKPPSITGTLPKPEYCDNCCSLNVILTENSIVYGRNQGDWPLCYYCTDCLSMVGCHPNTEIPLGRLANKITRTLRGEAHRAFDPIWRNRLMHRKDAYAWLANKLGVHTQDCHMSWFTDEQLRTVIRISQDFTKNGASALERRKKKKLDKKHKRYDQVRRKISIRKSE